MTGAPTGAAPASGRTALVALALVLAVGLAYAPVSGFGFVTFDDPEYVFGNPAVSAGLSLEGLRWAFTTGHAANWHPLTWLSHMLDVELYELDAGGHHLTSVVLHALNAVLVLLLLASATGAFWRSALVAALFALHPLHVESVAWVAERKDVLSTCLGLHALLSWLGWARGRRISAYFACALLYAASLMAKPMLVTLPFLLLLLDTWPLGRLGGAAARRGAVLEKLPLLALAAASCAVTFAVQRAGRALEPAESVPLAARAANALIAYARYLVMTLWPVDLAVLYPHPALSGGTPLEARQVAGSALLLGGASFAALRWRRLGWPLTGWLWYVGTLVPVIGLVQVGSQAQADRYTYVPLIGVFVLVAWGAGALLAAAPRARAAVVAGACAIVLACGIAARDQVGVWRDATTLYERALAVAPKAPVLLVNIGVFHRHQGRVDEAIAWYERALAIEPGFALARYNLAVALHVAGRTEEAERAYRSLLEVAPRHVKGWHNLGQLLRSAGREEEARECLRRAVELEPRLSAAERPPGN